MELTGSSDALRPRFLRLRSPVGRRLAQLLPGLVLFGTAIGFIVAADLGANPWTVLAQGIAERLGVSVGLVVSLIGVTLLALFVPLREPAGPATVLNVLLVGPVVDVVVAAVPDDPQLAVRVVLLAVAPPLLGVATGLYLGSGLGPGPRDGLMTAWARRGVSVGIARTGIELTALTLGWLLGGVVGVGTVYVGVTVGFWVRTFLPRLRIDAPPG